MANKKLLAILILFLSGLSVILTSEMVSSNGTDTDGDGLTDYDEDYVYHTNKFFRSTDGDKYDDRMEILGTSKEGEQMPWWVKPPGDNVLVAAYPVISVTVSDTISIYEIQEIYTETRNISMTSVGYSMSQTEGSSISAGTTEGHTHSQWIDVGNEQEDQEQYESYRDRIESSEEKYFTQYTTKNGTEWEIGAGAEVSAGMGTSTTQQGKQKTVAGVTASAYVYGYLNNRAEAGSTEDHYKGTGSALREGENLQTLRIRKSSESKGSSWENSFSTTITRTSYRETTVTNTHEVATGHEWATAWTIDTENAAKLRFTFYIENTGTDKTDGLHHLRFNIYIGDNQPITYPSLEESPDGLTTGSLYPDGPLEEFSGEVTLKLQELRDVDEGKPIRIAPVFDFHDRDTYENAKAGNVLVEIDDGLGDGDENLDYYMTSVRTGETYLDILKRLNQTVRIKGEDYRIEVPLSLDDNGLTSVKNLPVTKWSWWDIYLQEITEETDFRNETATRGKRMLLVYRKDSDHDYYTDRTEIHLGTDPDDSESHPSPILVVGACEWEEGGNKTIKLKFSNFGDYDAYGIEARLYSPDTTTSVSDSLIGGTGRVEAGETFVPDDAFAFTNTTEDYTDPVVVVYYNDPQGFHSFIAPVKLPELNESLLDHSDKMLYEPELGMETNEEYNYYDQNWLIVEYENPDNKTIENAKLYIAYQNLSGHVTKQVNETVNIRPGKNSFVFWWSPSENYPEEIIGEELKVVSVLTDSEENFIYDDVERFRIIEYPSWPKLIHRFSGGSESETLTWDSASKETVWADIPKDSVVKTSSMRFRGYDILNPSLDVGNSGGEKEWAVTGVLGEDYVVLNTLNDLSTEKILTFDQAGSKEVWVKLPKNSKIIESTADISLLSYSPDPTGSLLIIDGAEETLYGTHVYDRVEVKNGGILRVAPYNGTPGTGSLDLTAVYGIYVDISSSIEGIGKGHNGGEGVVPGTGGLCGVGGTGKDGNGTGYGSGGDGYCCTHYGDGGGGGGYGDHGGAGAEGLGSGSGGAGGVSYGQANGSSFEMGSGGGAGGKVNCCDGSCICYCGGLNGNGGDGGASIKLYSPNIFVEGLVTADGEKGGDGTKPGASGAGGGGSGGTVMLNGIKIELGNASVEGGPGGRGGCGGPSLNSIGGGGGGGSGGRIKIFYSMLENSSSSVNSNGGSKGERYRSGCQEVDPSGTDGGMGTVYYEYSPYNLTLDTGDDGIVDWGLSIEPSDDIDLNMDALQDYLDDCIPDQDNFCDVPLKFIMEQQGKMEISGIRIKYSHRYAPSEEEMATAVVDRFNDSDREKEFTFDTEETTQQAYFTIPRTAVEHAELYIEGEFYGEIIGENLTVDGTEVTMHGTHFYDNVEIINGGKIYVTPYNGTPGTGTLQLIASESIFIDEQSEIIGAFRGYRGGGIAQSGEGPGGGGGGAFASANPGSGGGYGGAGGQTVSGGGGTYGSADGFDLEMGSGGGGGGNPLVPPAGSSKGGSGGAMVFLQSNRITLNGKVNSIGGGGQYQANHNAGAGGGSGGGVLVNAIVANLTSATIDVRAGNGGLGDSYQSGCGGGGGRIKIFSSTLYNNSAVLNSSGGLGCPPHDCGYYISPSGNPGTIHYGNEYVSQNNFSDLNLSVDEYLVISINGWPPENNRVVFTDELNEYLSSMPLDNQAIDVPIIIKSDSAGKIILSNLSVVYKYSKIPDFSPEINAFLETCTPDGEGNCQVPFDFFADSDGSLEAYDLRVFYRQKNYPPSIDSYWPDYDPSLDEGDGVEFSMTKSDANLDPLEVTWYLDGDEVGTGDAYRYFPDYKSSGLRNLTVVVSDGEMGDSHTWLVTVNDVAASEVYVYPGYRKSAMGLEFLVDVSINATDEVYSAGFELHFDKVMLNATGVEEGDFLNKDSASTYYEAAIENDAGKVTFAGTRAGVYMGVSGGGRLARIRFKSISHGSGDFELGNVEISDPDFNPLPYFTSDGTFMINILAGDVDDDCEVDIFDLARVGKAYSSRPGDPYWNENADLNGDWVINIFDLATVGVNYGRRC